MSSEVIFVSEVSHAIDLKAEMTSDTQILTAKQKKSMKSIPRTQFHEVNFKKSISRSQVVRIIDGDDELKKHSRKSPEIQFKKLNKKLRSTLPDQHIN